jgi:hypothetical protein
MKKVPYYVIQQGWGEHYRIGFAMLDIMITRIVYTARVIPEL